MVEKKVFSSLVLNLTLISVVILIVLGLSSFLVYAAGLEGYTASGYIYVGGNPAYNASVILHSTALGSLGTYCNCSSQTVDYSSVTGFYTVSIDNLVADYNCSLLANPGDPCAAYIDLNSDYVWITVDGSTVNPEGQGNGSLDYGLNWSIFPKSSPTVFSNISTNITELLPLNVTLTAPSDNSLNGPAISFICNATDNFGLKNITLYGNWTGWHANETKLLGGIQNSSIFTKTLSEGTYIWNCLAYDIDGNSIWAANNFTSIVDATGPAVNIETPKNNTVENITNIILFEYNVTDSLSNVSNCSFYINGVFQETDTDVEEGTTQNFTSTLVNDNYNWSITCYDDLGNSGSSGLFLLNVSVSSLSGWYNIIPPEGIFEPYNASLSGTHANLFSIRFVNLTINTDELLSCSIKTADGSILTKNITGLSLSDQNYSLNHTVQTYDPIVDNPSVGYIPWVLKNCSISKGAILFSENTSSWSANKSRRIYVHSPVYWDESEITRAVACAGSPGKYFNNTMKCEYQEDTKYAIQMYAGSPAEESCMNHPGVGGASEYCRGIFFPTNDPLEYFGGVSALSDDPNGYTTFTVSFSGYNTGVAYSRYVNSSGNLKIRVRQALSSKTFSITIYNLTNVSSANAYGAQTGSGSIGVNDYGDGTWTVSFDRLATPFTGTLDLTLNISFNQQLNEDRNLYIVLAYGADTNQLTPTYFPINFSSSDGLKNDDESENTNWTTGFVEGGVCGDEANNDFDYLGGTWPRSYDCFDPDCNGSIGDNSQTNEFGTGKTGLCNYQTELNCTDEFDNDYDYIAGADYTDCHDADCFHNDPACPLVELICNDTINNDWDYTNTESDSSNKIGNNGSKYGVAGTSDLTDCEDPDCDSQTGGNAGQLCNWGYELNCSDNFDNDVLQLKDCEIQSGGNFGDAEYDCSAYCRINNNSAETGDECSDNTDNDFDLWTVTSYYGGSANTSYGAGMDCRWITLNPDEDCNQSYMPSSGFTCELGKELTCNDSSNNDFDLGYTVSAGWSASAYNTYFNSLGMNYSQNADCDDYDCLGHPSCPTDESLNSSWCFDNTDNDLDSLNDCADPDCLGVTNPANVNQTCLTQEYNSSVPFFQSLPYPGIYCGNNIDDDVDTFTDCADPDCFKQFDLCSQGPCYDSENLTWNSCADGTDNDYAEGTDCADHSDCDGMLASVTGALCEASESSCDDGINNDAAGGTDCADASCSGKIGGFIDGSPIFCGAENCSDGFDNDADGNMDCYDPDCDAVCGLSAVSGASPISLPQYSGQITLGGISSTDARIQQSTDEIRQGENYSIRMFGLEISSDIQWTLGTAGNQFDKSKFNNLTAKLIGPDAASFSLIETANGFRIDDLAGFNSTHDITFMIQSTSVLGSSDYELIYYDGINAKNSPGNIIPYQIHENVTPIVHSVNVSPWNGIEYGASLQIRANATDNSQFGRCQFVIYGADSYSANSNNCKIQFSPAAEGIYYVNVTPVDRYSNVGATYTIQHDLNIRPTGSNIISNKRFYYQSDPITINSTFDVDASDSLGECEFFLKNSSGAETSIATRNAAGSSCYASSLSLLGVADGVYTLFVRVNETTESDIVESTTKAIYVCSQTQNGTCRFADFDNDGYADTCGVSLNISLDVDIISPADNSSYNISDAFQITANITNLGNASGINCNGVLSIQDPSSINITATESLTHPFNTIAVNTSITESWNLTVLDYGFTDINLSIYCRGAFLDSDVVLNLNVPDLIDPTVDLESPGPNATFTTNIITFICNATDNRGLLNISLYGNWSGSWQVDQTIQVQGTTNQTSFNKTLPDGNYLWSCSAKDVSGKEGYASENRSFIIDSTAPSSGNINNLEGDTVPKYWDTDDDNNLTCQLNLPETSMSCRWGDADIAYSLMNASRECVVVSQFASCNFFPYISSQINQTTIYVSCKDEYGNEQNSSQNTDVTFGVDWSIPDVTNSNDGNIHLPGYNVTLTMKDMPQGTIVTVYHCNDTSGACDPHIEWKGTNGTEKVITFDQRGIWYLRWNVTDEAGNLNLTNQTKQTIIFINTLPNVTQSYTNLSLHTFIVNATVYDGVGIPQGLNLSCRLYHKNSSINYTSKSMQLISGISTDGIYTANISVSEGYKVFDQIETYVNCTDGMEYGLSDYGNNTIPNLIPGAPVIEIIPQSPQPYNDLFCNITTISTDTDLDVISYSYQWYKDGVNQNISTPNVSSSFTWMRENWTCAVTPNDGYENGYTGVDTVFVRNSPPVFDTGNPISNLTWPEDTVYNLLNLSEHFLDVDEDLLTYFYTPVDNISVYINQTTSIVTFVPDADFYGVRYISFNVTDTFFFSNRSNIISLNVTSVNDDPVIAHYINRSVNEDTDPADNWIDLYNYSYDVDHTYAQLVFSIDSQTNSSLIGCNIVSNRYINCSIPALDQWGTNFLNVSVSDGEYSNSSLINISVIAVNDAPINSTVVYPPPYSNSTDNTPFFNSTDSFDPDGDNITYYFELDTDMDCHAPGYSFTSTISEFQVIAGQQLPDGIYYICMMVCDDSGSANSCTNTNGSVRILIDTTPPVITIVEPDPSEIMGWVIPLLTDIEDNLIGVDRAWFEIINSTGQVVESGNLTEAGGWDYYWNSASDLGISSVSSISSDTLSSYINEKMASVQADSYNFTFNVSSNDKLGNLNSNSVGFTIDFNIPSVNIIYPDKDNLTTDFNVSILVQSSNLSISWFNLTNASGFLLYSNYTGTINTSSWTWDDFINISGWPSGRYNITAYGEDISGINTTEKNYFNLDIDPPYYTDVNITPNIVYNDVDLVLNVTWLDNNQIEEVYIMHNASGSWVNSTVNHTGNRYYAIIPSSQLENQETVWWRSIAMDNFGLWNTTMGMNSFFVMNRIPSFNSSNPISTITWPEDTADSSLNLGTYLWDLDLDNLTYGFTSILNVSVNINQVSTVVTFTPSPDFYGVRHIIFSATDILNTTYTNNVTLNITPVNDAPNMTAIILNQTRGKNGTPIRVTSVGAVDIDSASYFLECGNSSGVYDLCQGTLGTGERTCDFITSWTDNIAHNIYCILNDTEGISSQREVVFTADNIAPTITNIVTNPALPLYDNGSGQNISVFFTSDSYPNHVIFYLYNESGDIVDTQGPIIINSFGDLPVNYTLLSNMSDANYTLNMSVSDQYGNQITYTLGNIIVDSLDPSVSLYINDTSLIIGTESVFIDWNATDINMQARIINITYPDDSSLYQSVNPDIDITLTPVELTQLGLYNVIVYARDYSGNEVYIAQTFTVIDLNVPQVDLIQPLDMTYTNNTNISFICNASDNIGLFSTSLYHNISGNFTLNQTVNISGTNNQSIFLLNNISDGKYLWNCKSVDTDNNSNFGVQNYTLIVDSQDPTVVPLGCIPDPVSIFNDITCSVNITDNIEINTIIGKVNHTNGTVYTPAVSCFGTQLSRICNFTFIQTSVPGTYDILWYVNDSAGNAAQDQDNFSVQMTKIWDSIFPPFGIYEPLCCNGGALTGDACISGAFYNPISRSGDYYCDGSKPVEGEVQHIIKISFNGLYINSTDTLGCVIETSNRTRFFLNTTGLSLANATFSLNYTLGSDDDIYETPTLNGVSWYIHNCSILESGIEVYGENIDRRIYVHKSREWTDTDLTLALACEGITQRFFNNTAFCTQNLGVVGTSKEYIYSVHRNAYVGAEGFCYDSSDDDSDSFIDSADDDCLTWWDNYTIPDYAPGYNASTRSEEDIGLSDLIVQDTQTNLNEVSLLSDTRNVRFISSIYTDTTGGNMLEIRIRTGASTRLNSKYNLFIKNLPSEATDTGMQIIGKGLPLSSDYVASIAGTTFNLACSGGGCLSTDPFDIVVRIPFTSAPSSNATLTYQIIWTNGGDSSSTGSVMFGAAGITNNDESETDGIIGIDSCADMENNDLDISTDYSIINNSSPYDQIGFSRDCADQDCHGQSGPFISGVQDICYYKNESTSYPASCRDSYDNDFNDDAVSDVYWLSSSVAYTDCHDLDCFREGGLNTNIITNPCPSYENNSPSWCYDGSNNDWDYVDTESDISHKIGDSGWNNLKYHHIQRTSELIDCEDKDCDRYIGNITSGALCEWGNEMNCTDGFDNDVLQLKDCELQSVASDTSAPTISYAEYDCSPYCRNTINDNETGVLCEDRFDNDWDAVIVTGYYTGTANNTKGAGIDCRWIAYNPDEDCNMTMMSLFRCELGTELTCNDGYDNDFDHDNPVRTNPRFYDTLNIGMEAADCDDYDCSRTIPGAGAATSNCPLLEYITDNGTCFDSVDNDLDYKFDCADPDCLGVMNPNVSGLWNGVQMSGVSSCAPYELNATALLDSNASTSSFNFCGNLLDDEADPSTDNQALPSFSYNSIGQTLNNNYEDCNDADCRQQFGQCAPCSSDEFIEWDSCFDSLDNDHAGDGVDMADADCTGQIANKRGFTLANNPATETSCMNQYDDDSISGSFISSPYQECRNEQIECAGQIFSPDGRTCPSVYTENTDATCNDDFDNDNSGGIDCYDVDCFGTVPCGAMSTYSGNGEQYVPANATYNLISGKASIYYSSIIRKGGMMYVRFNFLSDAPSTVNYIGSLSYPINTTIFNTSAATCPDCAANGFTLGLGQASSGIIQISKSSSVTAGTSVTIMIPSRLPYDVMDPQSVNFYVSLATEGNAQGTRQIEVVNDQSPSIGGVKVEPGNGMITVGDTIYMRGHTFTGISSGQIHSGQSGWCKIEITGAITQTLDNPNGASERLCVYTTSVNTPGTYNFTITPYDSTGNQGLPVTESLTIISAAPKMKQPLARSQGKRVHFKSDNESLDSFDGLYNNKNGEVEAEFITDPNSPYNSDSCSAILRSENGSVVSVQKVKADFPGEDVTCTVNISTFGLADGMYTVSVNATDGQGYSLETQRMVFFVCDDLSSSGASWDCALADFDVDGYTEGLMQPFNYSANNQDPIYNLPCDSCPGIDNIGQDIDGDGVDDACQMHPICGNNILEAGEVCDGVDLGANNCRSQGFNNPKGILTCLPDCSAFNTTRCEKEKGRVIRYPTGWIVPPVEPRITGFPCLSDWGCGEWGACTEDELRYKECFDQNSCVSIPEGADDFCDYEWPEGLEKEPSLELPSSFGNANRSYSLVGDFKYVNSEKVSIGEEDVAVYVYDGVYGEIEPISVEEETVGLRLTYGSEEFILELHGESSVSVDLDSDSVPDLTLEVYEDNVLELVSSQLGLLDHEDKVKLKVASKEGVLAELEDDTKETTLSLVLFWIFLLSLVVYTAKKKWKVIIILDKKLISAVEKHVGKSLAENEIMKRLEKRWSKKHIHHAIHHVKAKNAHIESKNKSRNKSRKVKVKRKKKKTGKKAMLFLYFFLALMIPFLTGAASETTDIRYVCSEPCIYYPSERTPSYLEFPAVLNKTFTVGADFDYVNSEDFFVSEEIALIFVLNESLGQIEVLESDNGSAIVKIGYLDNEYEGILTQNYSSIDLDDDGISDIKMKMMDSNIFDAAKSSLEWMYYDKNAVKLKVVKEDGILAEIEDDVRHVTLSFLTGLLISLAIGLLLVWAYWRDIVAISHELMYAIHKHSHAGLTSGQIKVKLKSKYWSEHQIHHAVKHHMNLLAHIESELPRSTDSKIINELMGLGWPREIAQKELIKIKNMNKAANKKKFKNNKSNIKKNVK